jgi:hypothetical protein
MISVRKHLEHLVEDIFGNPADGKTLPIIELMDNEPPF